MQGQPYLSTVVSRRLRGSLWIGGLTWVKPGSFDLAQFRITALHWELGMNLTKPWTPSSIVLILAGIALIGTGSYFVTIRPALLPEDIRYMALSEAQFDFVRPRLEVWLRHVFGVMGGYVLATGVLAITLAATSFRAHHPGAAVGALIAGGASIGWMAVVNFVIDSDFKWLLLGMALLWACSLVLFWIESKILNTALR